MDTTLLKTFLEVAKTRHFGRSADALFITQSAVSARIKLLEETLGVELFIRKRNDIQLTPAGQRLQKHAENLVRGWERARQDIALDPNLAASLSVGCIFDLWKIQVQGWAVKLRKASPDIALQLDILSAESLVQRLTMGSLDLAFMFDPPRTPDLELKQVKDIPLILVSSRAGEDVTEAMSKNYIMVDWGSAFSIIHAEKFPSLASPVRRTNSGEIALGLLKTMGGAAYLPKALVSPLLKSNSLYQVVEAPVIKRLAYVVYRPENIERYSLQKALAVL